MSTQRIIVGIIILLVAACGLYYYKHTPKAPTQSTSSVAQSVE